MAKELDPEAVRHFERIGLAKELYEYATILLPDPAVEAQAQKDAAERASADRTAWFQTVRELCQRAKAGDFGEGCKKAVEFVLADPDPSFTPAMKAVDCEKIINAARREQVIAQRNAKRHPSRGAR
jgi:hypothetical protein